MKRWGLARRMPTSRRRAPPARAGLGVSLALLGLGLLIAPAVADPAATSYDLVLASFNITDHNLTYATNMVPLSTPWSASWNVSIASTLRAADGARPELAEAEIGLGPIPAGGDETNITPLLIVQEAASGLLRVEYIPYPMNDTYGSVVYEGYPVAAGSTAFSGHVLALAYVATAPPVPAYSITLPFARVTGNLTLYWDGSVLAPATPIAWASLGAFYAYGLSTGQFASGSVTAQVVTGPVERPAGVSSVLHDGQIGAVLEWLVAAAIASVVTGAAVATIRLRRNVR